MVKLVVPVRTKNVNQNERDENVINLALLVRLEAKPGKEPEVENFLRRGSPIVEEDQATTNWYGIRLGPSTFGIFEALPEDSDRQAHHLGCVAAALMARATELFARPPVIEKVDVLATKLPQEELHSSDTETALALRNVA
jgi:hypothetical protein